MNGAIDLVLECMKEKGMTQTELARSLGEDVRVINQQLHRQQDLKAARFLDVMEHMGYRVELVDNEGIRKVSEDAVGAIASGEVKGDRFYMQKDDGSIVGIRMNEGVYETKEFWSKPECFEWLLCDAQKIGENQ